MQNKFLKGLFFFLVLMPNSLLAQYQCLELFSLPKFSVDIPEKLLIESAKLGFYFDQKITPLDAYLNVLIAFENASPKNTINPQLSTLLNESFKIHYRVPVNKEDLLIFYKNALRALYARFSDLIREQEILAILGTEASSAYSKRVFGHIIDSYFSFGGLQSDSIQISVARLLLDEKPWRSYPFKDAMAIIQKWETGESFKEGFFHFHKWYEKNPDLPQLSFKDLERLYLAVMKSDKPRSSTLCCKSAFACKICPHNRSWLKDRD